MNKLKELYRVGEFRNILIAMNDIDVLYASGQQGVLQLGDSLVSSSALVIWYVLQKITRSVYDMNSYICRFHH